MKRAKGTIDNMNPKAWMDYMFDHTTLIAEDDPYLEGWKAMDQHGLIQLRVIPHVGAERFAEFIFNKLNDFIKTETDGRVRITKVEFMENNKNSATYAE